MPTWALTLLFSVIVVTLALLGMSIGYLISGRPLQKKCGSKPSKSRDKSCGTGDQTCELCDPTQQKEGQNGSD